MRVLNMRKMSTSSHFITDNMPQSVLRFVRIAPLLVLSGSLFAQPAAELGPLQYQPRRQQTTARRPLSFELGGLNPAPDRLGAVQQSEMEAVHADPNLSLRGIERPINRSSRHSGQWVTLENGQLAWQYAIQSDGAAAVRVQFSDFSVGNGQVFIYGPDHAQVFGPYTGNGPDGSGSFWSNLVSSDTIVVEYQPEASNREVPFSITSVGHLYPTAQALAAGTCELDVSCYPPWSTTSSGVAVYIFQKSGSMYACTGALINNSNLDHKPYFLTSDHCVGDAPTAATVVIIWNYQTPSCNGAAPNIFTLPQTLGSTFLAGSDFTNGDYSLIQLSSLPNLNLTFYGWSASTTALNIGDPTVGVHHPAESFTRIAFGVRAPDINTIVSSELAPANLYYQVNETSGRVEPGSSGSPLFTQNQVIVGNLSFGPSGDACSTTPYIAGYGRFSNAYPNLAQWLSPGGATSTLTANPSSIKIPWTIGTAAPGSQPVQLTTTSTSAVTLSASATQSWIIPSASSVSVSSSAPANLGISFNTAAFTAAGTYTGSVSVSGGGMSQSISVEVDVSATVAPPTLTPTPSSFKIPWTIGTAAPASQNIQLATTSTSAVTLSASVSQAWIGLGASSVSVSKTQAGNLGFSLNTAYFGSAGTYTGSITVAGGGMSQTISVEVDVSAAAPPPTLTATPTSFKMPWTIGTSLSQGTQNVQLTTTSTSAITLSASANQSWIGLTSSSVTVSSSQMGNLGFSINTAYFSTAGTYMGSITTAGGGLSQNISVEVDVTAAPTVYKGGQTTVSPLFIDGSGAATTFTLSNPYSTATNASISFLAFNGTAITQAVTGQGTASWFNFTIQPFASTVVTTSGTSSPQHGGFALIQTTDPTKRIAVTTQINNDMVATSQSISLPMVIPFDATSTPSTTLYIFNPAASGAASFTMSVYNSAGTLVGSTSASVPAQQEGTITMNTSAALFGGNKGLLYLSGSGPLTVMGIHTAADGRLSSVAPANP
jgi:hypothetical protein